MNDYDIWFILCPIATIDKINLLNKFNNTSDIWYYVINHNFYEQKNDKIFKILKYSWDTTKIDKLKKCIEAKKIKIVTYYNDLYPKRLKVYNDAPYALFYKGNIENLNLKNSAGIVGSRKCSSYGINVTQIITKALCQNNISIISGLAKGIDYTAHKNCLDSNGYTCGVLGCGIDIIYPKDNAKLYEEIIERGCIISEFLPGTPPYSYNFPIRNRIISALSDIVIVVEANEKSGSLITARIALEQGKDVMAVPGNIFSKQSKGTNKLIKDGAYPVTELQDISDILGVSLKYEDVPKINKKTGIEKKIYDLISNTPIHVDDIIRITNIDIECLYEVLFEMQIKDEIMVLPGNYYVKLNNKI